MLHLAVEQVPWSPATHHLFPPAFRLAVRTLLLATAVHPASDSEASQPGQQERRRPGRPGLNSLPTNCVLKVVELMATPLHSCAVWF